MTAPHAQPAQSYAPARDAAGRPTPIAERKPMIECREVHKYYGDYHALRGIDLTIREAEFFSLLGPSGCGKTTLLHVLGGILRPGAGTVEHAGRDLASLSDAARTRDARGGARPSVLQRHVLQAHPALRGAGAAGRFMQALAEHARAEGEGDRTLAAWRQIHERFWTEHSHGGFAADMLVVCERFRLIHPR